jgi:hypothetical protein
MRKLFLLFLLVFANAAYAAEHNSDTGFDNPSAWMLDPSSPNLWTVSGSKANGNGATTMQMLMQMNSTIKEGHKYKYTLTVTNRTTGVLKVAVGLTMTGTSTFSALTAPLTSISDTFTTANGLHAVTPKGSGDAGSGEVRAAFRMFCSGGPQAPVDPVVYPGLKGRSHLHRFFGNTGAVNPSSSYSTLRTMGMTTCGSTTPLYPINRSAYWAPAMLDGVGNSVNWDTINLYYKTFPDTSDFCANPSYASYLLGTGGACVNVPTGLRMIMGSATGGAGGVLDANPGVLHFECWEWSTNPGVLTIHGPYYHMRDLFASGSAPCPVGGMLGIFANFPTCWDGTNLDSSDHKSHMAYPLIATPAGWNKCDNAHPNMIPSIEIQFYYEIDANFAAGKWRLSSDEMVAAAATDPGMTFHTDYMMAWSPSSLTQINLTCWRPLNSCSSGDLGNGTAINGGGTIATSAQADGAPDGHPLNVARYEPTAKAGMGPPISSNGTFSGEIIAAADGKFALIGVADTSGAGFNGQVDSFSLTDITSGHKGPVTVHN